MSADLTFTAAMVQMRTGLLPGPSLDQGARLIREAAAAGADYVLTPEVSNMMQLNRTALFEHLQSEDDDRSLAAYRELARELDRQAGDVNGRFSEFDWTPLRYLTRAAPRNVISGFFRIARIGVVTPLHDGMNLVAKEFVAAQDPRDPGVLILSRFAGAAEELTEALVINPYDPDEIADAMHQALVMGADERRARHGALRAKVFAGTAAAFARRYLAALEGGTGTTAASLSPPLRHLAASLRRNSA